MKKKKTEKYHPNKDYIVKFVFYLKGDKIDALVEKIKALPEFQYWFLEEITLNQGRNKPTEEDDD